MGLNFMGPLHADFFNKVYTTVLHDPGLFEFIDMVSQLESCTWIFDSTEGQLPYTQVVQGSAFSLETWALFLFLVITLVQLT